MIHLGDLKVSFEYIDENLLNMFAQVLTKISRSLTSLEIINHGEVDKGL